MERALALIRKLPAIFHQIREYQGAHHSKNTVAETSLSCTRLDLCRSLVTVGNPSFLSWQTIRKYGFLRALYDSVLSKFALVMSNLKVREGNFCRHQIFDSYVSDQKRIVSYNLGMAFSKLYAEKVFDIPSLVHVEFLKKRNAVVLQRVQGKARGKEPDLVGADLHGNWHVFEAKGVSRAESQLPGKIVEAKDQLNQVLSIHAAQPETRSACATFLGTDRILSYIVDPPSKVERKIEISREKYLEAYYSPVLLSGNTLISSERQTRQIDGISVETVLLEKGSQRILIGLETELFEQTLDRIYDYSDSLRGKLRQYAQRDDETYSIGLDGYFLQRL